MDFANHVKTKQEKFGAVIFDTLREKVFVTNQTGSDLIKLIEKGKTIGEIAAILGAEYAVRPDKIGVEINGFVEELKAHNLLALEESRTE